MPTHHSKAETYANQSVSGITASGIVCSGPTHAPRRQGPSLWGCKVRKKHSTPPRPLLLDCPSDPKHTPRPQRPLLRDSLVGPKTRSATPRTLTPGLSGRTRKTPRLHWPLLRNCLVGQLRASKGPDSGIAWSDQNTLRAPKGLNSGIVWSGRTRSAPPRALAPGLSGRTKNTLRASKGPSSGIIWSDQTHAPHLQGPLLRDCPVGPKTRFAPPRALTPAPGQILLG